MFLKKLDKTLQLFQWWGYLLFVQKRKSNRIFLSNRRTLIFRVIGRVNEVGHPDWSVWLCLWRQAPGLKCVIMFMKLGTRTEVCDYIMKTGTRTEVCDYVYEVGHPYWSVWLYNEDGHPDWSVWLCLWSWAPVLKCVIMFMKTGTRTLPLSGTASQTRTEEWIEHTTPSPMLADGWLQL